MNRFVGANEKQVKGRRPQSSAMSKPCLVALNYKSDSILLSSKAKRSGFLAGYPLHVWRKRNGKEGD